MCRCRGTAHHGCVRIRSRVSTAPDVRRAAAEAAAARRIMDVCGYGVGFPPRRTCAGPRRRLPRHGFVGRCGLRPDAGRRGGWDGRRRVRQAATRFVGRCGLRPDAGRRGGWDGRRRVRQAATRFVGLLRDAHIWPMRGRPAPGGSLVGVVRAVIGLLRDAHIWPMRGRPAPGGSLVGVVRAVIGLLRDGSAAGSPGQTSDVLGLVIPDVYRPVHRGPCSAAGSPGQTSDVLGLVIPDVYRPVHRGPCSAAGR